MLCNRPDGVGGPVGVLCNRPDGRGVGGPVGVLCNRPDGVGGPAGGAYPSGLCKIPHGDGDSVRSKTTVFRTRRTAPGKAQTQTIFSSPLCTHTVHTSSPSTRSHTF